MPLVIDCMCGKKLKVRDELAGKNVKCPGCGKAVLAPPPVVEEPVTVVPVDEEVMAGEPPVAPAAKPRRSDEEETEPDADAPAWEVKKKKSVSKERDDSDEEGKPAPHWVFPGALSSEVMALAHEGIWFASLKGDVLKEAISQLKDGAAPPEVLGKKAYYIPWVTVKSIYCNRKRKGFTIAYNANGQPASKILTPSDRAERNEIMDAIEDFCYPDLDRTVKKHTALTAMILPIASITITFAVTIGIAITSVFIGGNWEGRGRGAAIAALFNLIHWLGIPGTCGIGFLVGACMMLWMLVRVMNPPIEVTLAPVPPERRHEEED